VSFRAIIHAGVRTAGSMPRWVRPFLWTSTAIVLLFAGLIWPVAALCMSMRPLYERRRRPPP
jgi:hypothetical protein